MVSKKELREDVDSLLVDIGVIKLNEHCRRNEIENLRTEIGLLKLNKEAELYDIEFTKTGDMFNVYKEGEFYTALNSLDDIRKRFAGYEEGIGDITVAICDDCIDSCLESTKNEEEGKKVLSSKKK